jgi:glycine cleavage system protein P-like pyridoxal-binding family
METIIIESTDSITTQKIKDFLKELKVSYKTKAKKEKDKPYDPAFVKKILERAESAKQGNTIKIDPKDIWGSLGLK